MSLTVNILSPFTYRTSAHIVKNNPLTVNILSRFKMHIKCALERTKNVRLKSRYVIDSQLIEKSNVH